MRVAIVGAGPAGAICAQRLVAAGHEVTLFDKGRGPGGRASSRRTDVGRFDHGAQYLTCREPELMPWLERWRAAGVLEPWRARFAVIDRKGLRSEDPSRPRWVGAPRMSAWIRALQRGLEVRFGHRVTRVTRAADGWRLEGEQMPPAAGFDAALVSAPAPQAAALLGEHPFAARLAAVRVTPCWAALLARDTTRTPTFDAASFEGDGPLAWAALETSKPGRQPGPQRWVLHATPAWSRAQLEAPREQVAELLAAALEPHLSAAPRQLMLAHLWRYALVEQPLGEPCLWDAEQRLGVLGDGCLGGRLEAALCSGLAMAEQVGA